MSIISHNRGVCLGAMDAKIGQYGLLVKVKTGKGRPQHLNGCKRGKISGFSSGAVRRLRETLFLKTVENAQCIGATFTVPWKVEKCSQDVLDRFHATYNRFRVAFCRAFPFSSVIYRVELQKRGAPHLHAVVYLSPKDIKVDASRGLGAPVVPCRGERVKLHMLWLNALDSDDDYFRAMKYSTKFDVLDRENHGALFRYLCDHTSKKKQAQLGYPGRQWGVIGSSNLISSALLDLPPFLSAHHEGVFFRLIRKLTRYRISDELRSKKWKRPPVFGCIYRGGHRRRGAIFLKGGGQVALDCYKASRALIEKGSMTLGLSA